MTFLIFLLAYTLSQFFRSFLAVIAPELGRDLHLDLGALGYVSSAWFFAFALAQFGVGIGLDRLGPRRTVAVSMLAAVAGSFVFAAAHSFWMCVLGMALIGVGCSAVYMGALFIFARTLPPQRFALMASWMIGLGSVGNLLGATPLSWAAATFGWRAAFVVIAGITLVSAALVLLFVTDPARVRADGIRRSAWAELGSILAIRALWPMLPLVAVSYAVVAAERGLWVGPYLALVHNLDGIARGNGTLAMALAMSAGAIIYGPLDQALGTKKWVVWPGSLMTALAFLVLAISPGLGVLSAVAILIVIGAAGLTYGVLMAHTRMFFPEALLGRGITFMNFIFIGGTGLLQVGSGWLIDQARTQHLSEAAVFSRLHLTFGLMLLGAALVYTFARERPAPVTLVAVPQRS